MEFYPKEYLHIEYKNTYYFMFKTLQFLLFLYGLTDTC